MILRVDLSKVAGLVCSLITLITNDLKDKWGWNPAPRPTGLKQALITVAARLCIKASSGCSSSSCWAGRQFLSGGAACVCVCETLLKDQRGAWNELDIDSVQSSPQDTYLRVRHTNSLLAGWCEFRALCVTSGPFIWHLPWEATYMQDQIQRSIFMVDLWHI